MRVRISQGPPNISGGRLTEDAGLRPGNAGSNPAPWTNIAAESCLWQRHMAKPPAPAVPGSSGGSLGCGSNPPDSALRRLMGSWRNWQTRWSQKPVRNRGGSTPLEPTNLGSFNGRTGGLHPPDGGPIPSPRTIPKIMQPWRNWHTHDVEDVGFAGSNPVGCTKSWVPGPLGPHRAGQWDRDEVRRGTLFRADAAGAG